MATASACSSLSRLPTSSLKKPSASWRQLSPTPTNRASSSGLFIPTLIEAGAIAPASINVGINRPDELARFVGVGDSCLHDAEGFFKLLVGNLERDEHADAVAIDA